MINDLIVRRVPGKGRGVFAGRLFRQGETIEICPVIPLKPSEARACSETILDDYFFEWGKTGRDYSLLLGFGGLYNHSSEPNAEFNTRLRTYEMVFKAIRDIRKGEEIFIDYRWPKKRGMPPPRVARVTAAPRAK